jgi:hypothetical protein
LGAHSKPLNTKSEAAAAAVVVAAAAGAAAAAAALCWRHHFCWAYLPEGRAAGSLERGIKGSNKEDGGHNGHDGRHRGQPTAVAGGGGAGARGP